MPPLQRKPLRQIYVGDNMQTLVKTLNGLSRGWLWLTILLMPILALAGGLGFQLTGFITGVAGVLALTADRSGAQYLRSAWPIWLLLFVLWAWVSALWSPYNGGLFTGNAATLFGLVIAILFFPLVLLKLPERQKSILSWGVIGAGLFGVALLLADAMTGYGVSLWADPVAAGEDPIYRLGQAEMNLGRGQVSYVQLLWPVAALLALRVKHGWILALAAFFGLLLSAQLNNLSIVIPTAILASVFAALAAWRPKLGLILAFALAISSLAFAPLLGIISSLTDVDLMRKIPLSWEHRLRMWAYSWELIQQAPLIGHGFDAARSFDSLTFRAPDGRDILVMSMHPHNIGIQIWLETGLVGVVLAIGFLLSLLKTALKTCTSALRAFAAAGLLATVATSGAVTVGVWQHWWWALIVLSASLICLIPLNLNKKIGQEL